MTNPSPAPAAAATSPRSRRRPGLDAQGSPPARGRPGGPPECRRHECADGAARAQRAGWLLQAMSTYGRAFTRPRSRRVAMISSAPGLRALASAAGAAVALGGVATVVFASGVMGPADRTLVTPVAPADDRAPPRTTPKADKTGTPVGPDASGPAAFGLCNAWTHHQAQDKDKPGNSVAFRNLAKAAGGEAKIAAYCAKVPHPGSTTAHQDAQGQLDVRRRPTPGKPRRRPAQAPRPGRHEPPSRRRATPPETWHACRADRRSHSSPAPTGGRGAVAVTVAFDGRSWWASGPSRSTSGCPTPAPASSRRPRMRRRWRPRTSSRTSPAPARRSCHPAWTADAASAASTIRGRTGRAAPRRATRPPARPRAPSEVRYRRPAPPPPCWAGSSVTAARTPPRDPPPHSSPHHRRRSGSGPTRSAGASCPRPAVDGVPDDAPLDREHASARAPAAVATGGPSTARRPAATATPTWAQPPSTAVPTPISVVPNQSPRTGSALRTYLEGSCPANSSSCLGANSGNLGGTPILQAWDSLVSTQRRSCSRSSAGCRPATRLRWSTPAATTPSTPSRPCSGSSCAATTSADRTARR